MRHIHFADDLEKIVAEALSENSIEFTHESENKDQQLDFYLPDYDVYIEVKRYHSDRVLKQLKSKDCVILIQGKDAVQFFKLITKA